MRIVCLLVAFISYSQGFPLVKSLATFNGKKHHLYDGIISVNQIQNDRSFKPLLASPVILQNDINDSTADCLLDIIENEDNENFGNETIINQLMDSLSMSYEESNTIDVDRFLPLLGNYDVIHVAASESKSCDESGAKAGRRRPRNSSPAGGKWTRKGGLAQKIFRERRKFQHLLPVNKTESDLVKAAQKSGKCNSTAPIVAEAVNVVSLDAFFGLFRLTVILKGDAIPLTYEDRINIGREKNTPGGLSAYAVRAFFDAPRIILGKRGKLLNFRLGPSSSVVLDTTFINSKIRLGKGSLGSRFVFKRCSEDDAEANEWIQLCQRKPLQKGRALALLACSFASGMGMSTFQGWKVRGISISIISSLLAAAVANSTGGIEDE